MKQLLSSGGSSLYECWSAGPSRVLVCSTRPSRRLLTDPVVCGSAYRKLVRGSVAEALRTLAVSGTHGLGDRIAALDVLRGGLSFGVADAVGEVFGIDPTVSFIGTERVSGRPIELTYPRWELGDADTLVIGDIIGTGSTLVTVLSEALLLASRQRHPLRSIVVFTIGSRLGAERLAGLVSGWEPAERPTLTVVALEALFELPAAASTAPFTRFPFDLVRAPGNTAPEFERHRLQAVGSLFERCAIYDGGVRAFTPAEHVQSRDAWWAEVVEHDVPLLELAKLTAGLSGYRSPRRTSAEPAPWLDDTTADELYELGHAAWRYAEQLTVAEYVDNKLAQQVTPMSPS